MCGCKAAEKKKVEKDSLKVRMPVTFVKGNYFGTPLSTTCKINKAGDKDRSLRKRGRSWWRGGWGGADTRRKGLMQDFMKSLAI
jgi:hypothetical protein